MGKMNNKFYSNFGWSCSCPVLIKKEYWSKLFVKTNSCIVEINNKKQKPVLLISELLVSIYCSSQTFVTWKLMFFIQIEALRKKKINAKSVYHPGKL